jgi:hypothetical protein
MFLNLAIKPCSITAYQQTKKKHTEKASSFPFRLTCRTPNSKKGKTNANLHNVFQNSMEQFSRYISENREQNKLNHFQNKWSILLAICTKIASTASNRIQGMMTFNKIPESAVGAD